MARTRRLTTLAVAAGLLSGGFAGLPAAGAAGPTQAQIDQGRELAFNRRKGNCLACHQIAGGDLAGTIGPELKDMKSRYPDRELLFKRVWDETQFNPQTVMPPFGRHKILAEHEIERIVDFLYTL